MVLFLICKSDFRSQAAFCFAFDFLYMMMASAPPAHPQKTGHRSGLSPISAKENTVPPISAKPISSRILLTHMIKC